jgi:hypothetical protein
MGDKKGFTCPNKGCSRVFTAPIKTLNLQDNPSEPYFACPFCLTRIDASQGAKYESHVEKPPVPKLMEEKPKRSDGDEKPASCGYHLGYLSEREKKEIPEECLVCRDIVSCMLKKMRG